MTTMVADATDVGSPEPKKVPWWRHVLIFVLLDFVLLRYIGRQEREILGVDMRVIVVAGLGVAAYLTYVWRNRQAYTIPTLKNHLSFLLIFGVIAALGFAMWQVSRQLPAIEVPAAPLLVLGGIVCAYIAWQVLKTGWTGILFVLTIGSVAAMVVGLDYGAPKVQDHELRGHISVAHATRFGIGILLTLGGCFFFRGAGLFRVTILLALGSAVSGLGLPWYLLEPPYRTIPAPEDSETLIGVFGFVGAGAAVLFRGIGSLFIATTCALIIFATCVAIANYDASGPFIRVQAVVEPLAGYYVSTAASGIGLLLCVIAGLRHVNPPPDPNVIPRMKEQFRRL